MEIKIALYETEIPQNLGGILRTCACFDVPVIIIEPLGFLFDDKKLKRAQMDYSPKIEKIDSFEKFIQQYSGNRKILLTPHTQNSISNFKFQDGDILVFGRESNGVEDFVAAKMDNMISIPMNERCRSLNLHISVSVTLSFLIQ
jgi:tRNA (cytidine/uridine-2'-O-)-methyltransferase